jgi:lipoprotein-anchoring transpeptidase ErfK/SrfK
VWLVEDDDYVTLSYAVSGRRGVPKPGNYHVRRKVNPGYANTLRLPWFVGFAFGSTTDIGFHGIPLTPSGKPIESDSQLGRPLSHGCVRENQTNARQLWDWAPMGTPVVVLP